MIKFCTPKINKKYIVSKIKRESLELFVDMKGTVAANNVAKIGLDVNLSVDNVYFKAGDFVKKGDIVVKFSDYQKSDISEKRALLAVKNAQLRNLEKQQELGADVNQKIQEVKGEINGLELEVKDEMKNAVLVQRTVRSPFDGYIVEINAVKGGTVNKNEPVVVLAKKNDLKIISESMTDEKIKNLGIGNMAEVSLFRRENEKAEALSKNIFLYSGASAVYCIHGPCAAVFSYPAGTAGTVGGYKPCRNNAHRFH